jgi:hypothetical protein
MDTRRCAYVYLRDSAVLLQGENRDRLLEIAGLYKSIVDGILAVIPYAMLNEAFDFNGNSEEPWSHETRQSLVGALERAIETEKKIQLAVKDILAYWGKES